MLSFDTTVRRGEKVIVFFSNVDSLEFHYEILSRTPAGSEDIEGIGALGTHLLKCPLFKLHGDIQQEVRHLR